MDQAELMMTVATDLSAARRHLRHALNKAEGGVEIDQVLMREMLAGDFDRVRTVLHELDVKINGR
jgi:hypothetical protein